MRADLLAERRRLCRLMPYLEGIGLANAQMRINQIDAELEGLIEPATRRIVLEYSPDEALPLASALECLAKAIRKGHRSDRSAAYLSAHPEAKIKIGSVEYSQGART